VVKAFGTVIREGNSFVDCVDNPCKKKLTRGPLGIAFVQLFHRDVLLSKRGIRWVKQTQNAVNGMKVSCTQMIALAPMTLGLGKKVIHVEPKPRVKAADVNQMMSKRGLEFPKAVVNNQGRNKLVC
jgi:hypothetical protein